MGLRKIGAVDLRVGMTVREVESSWLFSPLKSKNFTITSKEDIQKLLSYGIENVYIDEKDAAALEAEPESAAVSPEKTFAVPVSALSYGADLAVDIYLARDDGSLSLVLKKGSFYSYDACELIQSSGIEEVRVLESQREDYERYRAAMAREREKLSGEGFEGRYLDPANVEEHYRFMAEYFPISHFVLEPGSSTGFDIFIRSDGAMKKALDANGLLKEEALAFWREMDAYLVIHNSDRLAYREYIARHAKASKDRVVRASYVRETARLTLADLARDPRSEKVVGAVRDSVEDIIGIILDNPSAFYALMRVNSHDYYTFTHSVNVATLSLALGLGAGMTRRDGLTELGLGGMLHDIGKSFMDPRLLNKPGRLTIDEYEVIKEHVPRGYEMLIKSDIIPALSLDTVIQHHERLSGTGYPKGLDGQNINSFGRICAIADAYDALTTKRPYRAALTPFAALNLMSADREGFDRGFFALLVKLLHKQQAPGSGDG
ncbi:MAG: HD-GYP domain-containing protein [Candidatus Nitrospinota bacterium M3_3B_026]